VARNGGIHPNYIACTRSGCLVGYRPISFKRDPANTPPASRGHVIGASSNGEFAGIANSAEERLVTASALLSIW
jgi:hypothetical protein